MSFEIIRNDITRVRADAIVNAANPHPVVGAGTDTAIHKAAGPELLEARRAIGDIVPGDSAETPAFGLKAKYVIHTVTTGWIDGRHGEGEILRKAYDSALSLAGRLGCRSIAFPLLSAGSYGFPRELAMSVAIQAFTDFLMSHDMKIILAVFNKEAYSLAGSLFDDVKSFVDDNYVEERSYEERGREHFRPKHSEGWNRPVPGTALSGSRRDEEEGADYWQEAEFEEDLGEEIVFNAIADIGFAEEETEEISELTLEEILKRREASFVEYLRDLLTETGISDPVVYSRAGMSRQLFNKIINNYDYQPSKRTVYQLIIGMQLDLPKARKLMDKAGYAMTRSSRMDLMMEYFISHGRYNSIEIDVSLVDAGLPPLTRS